MCHLLVLDILLCSLITRFTWIYLMKDRSEFWLFLCHFNEVKHQFEEVIKVLQSDNGKECFL